MPNLLLKNSTYLIIASLEISRRLITDERILEFAYSLRKGKTHKPSKVAAAENFFSSVYVIDITCFDEYFIFHVITGQHCFL